MLRKIRNIFLVSLFFNLLLLGINFRLECEEEEIAKLIVGETKVFSTNSPSRVVVGNPAIADIVDVTNTEISVNAKSPGTTSLIFWDAFGEQSLKIKVVAEDMQEIKRRVDNLLGSLNFPAVYTQAEEDEAKVLILGNVKSPQDKERITVALATLKDKIVDLTQVKEEESVVDIDVQVLELDRDATDTLGFSWPGSVTISTDQTATSTYTGTTPTKWSTFFQITNWSRMPFEFRLDLLAQEGKARILSRPRLACQSGKEAELLVGGEKPIFTTTVAATSGAEGTEVEYKEYGIKLKIKPTVTEEGRIKLALNVEVSEVGSAEVIGTYTTSGVVTTSTARAYPLTKRTASTELVLNDGQTLAIGGLIKHKLEEDIRKTPGLADVPILGLLFRKKTTQIGGGAGERGETELFITLTPTITTFKEEPIQKVKEKVPVSVISPLQKDIPDEPLRGYATVIQKRILDNLTYPTSAKQAGFQGAVKLSLHLSYQGELLDIAVKDSSGYQILDDNAVAVAKRIGSYPPFPSSIEQKELWIEVPIVYRLD